MSCVRKKGHSRESLLAEAKNPGAPAQSYSLIWIGPESKKYPKILSMADTKFHMVTSLWTNVVVTRGKTKIFIMKCHTKKFSHYILHILLEQRSLRSDLLKHSARPLLLSLCSLSRKCWPLCFTALITPLESQLERRSSLLENASWGWPDQRASDQRWLRQIWEDSTVKWEFARGQKWSLCVL